MVLIRPPGNHFRFLKTYFQSVFLYGWPPEAARDVKGVWQRSLNDSTLVEAEPLLSLRFAQNAESFCPAELRCVTLDQQEALPCPEASGPDHMTGEREASRT